MKVDLFSFSDLEGGASRATYRLHKALNYELIDCNLHVMKKVSREEKIIGPNTTFRKFESNIRPHLANFPSIIFNKEVNPIISSPAYFNSYILNKINNLESDIINLHWINHEMISIEQISKIRKPLVLTLHDMWFFCGAEHYTNDLRWKEGYTKFNKPKSDKGFDINKWTWKRKLKYWKKPIHVICPSRWLANCAKESYLMKQWPIRVIPNTLDTNFWRPIEKSIAKSALNLDIEKHYILFGALSATGDKRKGFQYLKSILESIDSSKLNVEIILFGTESYFDNKLLKNFKVHNFGHLNDDLSLRIIYSAADLLIVPSLLEAFGQTASEAHSCGTAVLAFNNSGLSDIVTDGVTGSLVDINEKIMSRELIHLFSNPEILFEMGINARNKALKNWSYEIVAKKYIDLYQDIIDGN